MRRWAACLLLAAFTVALSACGGISVVADPTDLIRDARFIDLEDLPVPVSQQEVYSQPGFEGAAVLPGSEPRRLLIAVFGGCCAPTVTVAAAEVTGPPRLTVTVDESTGNNCCELLLMWPFAVNLNRDVDPAEVVLEFVGRHWLSR